MPSTPPIPTLIYRIIHLDNLATVIARGALHAPGNVPADGLPWKGIHAAETQSERGRKEIECGPGGRILDYVGFYLGPRSPMLYRIHTGWNVEKCHQSKIIYLVSTAQSVQRAGIPFVFSDRHSLAKVATFHDDLRKLSEVRFDVCYADVWKSTPDQPERQELKQAEFLVHRQMPWNLIEKIGCLTPETVTAVRQLLKKSSHQPVVSEQKPWYYLPG